MASRARTAGGIAVALVLIVISAILSALEIAAYGNPSAQGWASALDLRGLGLAAQLPFDVLLVITLVCYALAMVVPQGKLGVGQNLALTIWGFLMFIAGLVLAYLALIAFIGLVTLLLSFPFGTIAYFARYGCGGDAGGITVDALEGRCFGGVQGVSLLIVALKVAALAALAAGSLRYLKVRWLLFTVLLAIALCAALMFVLWLLSDLAFVLYPAEALVTVVLGLAVAAYGLFACIFCFYAFALGFAGQIG